MLLEKGQITYLGHLERSLWACFWTGEVHIGVWTCVACSQFWCTFEACGGCLQHWSGMGLLQAHEVGQDRPLANLSDKLNKHCKAYSAVKKESLVPCLGGQAFWSVWNVSHSVWEVEVYMDDNPLTFLAKFKTSNSRVFRWAVVLQSSPDVQHVAGKDNILADALSHIPISIWGSI